MKTISVIGIGRLGGALAIALPRVGYTLDALVFRTAQPARDLFGQKVDNGRLVRLEDLNRLDSEVVIIATPDGGIAAVAEQLSGKLSARSVVLHTSGALSSAVLGKLRVKGNPTGSMHPLVSISDPVTGANAFAGRYFCVEGDPAAAAAATEIAEKLGGIPFSIVPEHKPLYHAAAAMASGHLVALIQTSLDCMVRSGVDSPDAKAMLLSLVQSTVENLSTDRIENALTGPFARADLGTVNLHLDAFDETGMEEARQIYLVLGEKALEIAEKLNIDPKKAQAVRDRINMAKAKSK